MKKRLFYLLMAFILCLGSFAVLASCGGDSGNNDGTISPDPSELITPDSDAQSSTKSTEEMIADLAESEDFFSLFDDYCHDAYGNYLESTYFIDDLTITRRKTDEESGSDHVYVTVTASNDSCKYVGDFYLLYTFYDVGGWYLDGIELESGQLEPLSHVPDDYPIEFVLAHLAELDVSRENLSVANRYNDIPTHEAIDVDVDFNDGIIAVQGQITVFYYHDGLCWNFDYIEQELTYDILIDGTYESTDYPGYPAYLVINHENGIPVVRFTTGWGLGIDPFKVKDWEFDCAARAYTFYGGFDNDVYCKFYFGTDGVIYYYISGVESGTFRRITDPITDADDLWSYLIQAGKSW